MKVEHLTNNFLKIGAELHQQLSHCASFDIATAFINAEAIDVLEYAIQKNKRLTHGKLLISIYGYFNSKKDLAKLRSLVQRFPDKLSVHISRNRSFHWKYYHFYNTSINTIYVGSANFTSGGMSDNAELVLKITTKINIPGSWSEKIRSSFLSQWKNSGSISVFPIDEYPLIQKSRNPKKIAKELNAFFNKKNRLRNPVSVKSNKVVVCYLTKDVSAKTEKKIYGYNPTWKDDKIDYFICNGAPFYNQCLHAARILIIQRTSRQVYIFFWARIVDACDSVRTPDGKYFIAYKKFGSEKTLNTIKQEILLDKFGINLRAVKRPFHYRTLGRRQVMEISELLK